MFVNGFFNTKISLFNELEADFLKDGLEFCKEVSFELDSDEVTMFLKDIYLALVSDELDNLKLKDDFEVLVAKASGVIRLPEHVFLNFLIQYAKKSEFGIRELVSRIDFIIKGLKARKVVSAQPSVLNLNNDMFFEHPINTFKKIKDLEKSVTFLNLYDGVNIQNDGTILNIGEDSVTLQTTINQILAMKQEGNAYILKNDYFLKHIKADISDFNLSSKTITLTNFKRVEKMSASLRKHQRVHPNKFTRVTLKGENSELLGNLYDISKGGLSVLSQEDVKFHPHENITATFELCVSEDSCVKITLDLTLVVQISQNGFMRYCMQNRNQITPELDKFIDKRVQDTLDELNELQSSYR